MNANENARRGPAQALCVEQMAAIAAAGAGSDEPPVQLARLAVQLPCNADALAAARIEDIDREAGTLRVAGPAGQTAVVALSAYAALAVEEARGGRLSGPLVADVHGMAVAADACTEDYARELLTRDDGSPLGFDWSFGSLRSSMFDDMVENGVPLHVATAQAGLGTGGLAGDALDELMEAQRAGAEWWPYRLGLPPANPFDVARILASRPRPFLVDGEVGS